MIDPRMDPCYLLAGIRRKRMNPEASDDRACRFDVVIVTAQRFDKYTSPL